MMSWQETATGSHSILCTESDVATSTDRITLPPSLNLSLSLSLKLPLLQPEPNITAFTGFLEP